jgi:hypothetical protein
LQRIGNEFFHELQFEHEGEITKKYLEIAREAARDIDGPDNKIKVIVSVMMLREGWDVRNVTWSWAFVRSPQRLRFFRSRSSAVAFA